MDPSKLCEEWHKKKHVNPRTGRNIKIGGPTYVRLEKDCPPPKPGASLDDISSTQCIEFRKRPHIHPITKKRINTKAKTKRSVFHQLREICDKKFPLEIEKIDAVAHDEAMMKLIRAIKKHVGPLLDKTNTVHARVRFLNIMKNYLSSIQPCIEKEKKKLVLKQDGHPVVEFTKQIGSKSAYGSAYMNMGRGFGKLLQFSCKIMDASSKDNKLEVNILRLMTTIVEKTGFPHFPITYSTMICTSKCDAVGCPSHAKNPPYFVVFNELACCDVQNWFKTKRTNAQYKSILLQIVICLLKFHTLGLVHNDTHLGNFLIHETKPGGYWRYNIGDKDVFVKNCGYLLVLWDPGLARADPGAGYMNGPNNDMMRPLTLLSQMHSLAFYQKMGCKAMSEHVRDTALLPLMQKLYGYGRNEPSRYIGIILQQLLPSFHDVLIVDEKPDEHILNVKQITI